MRPDAPEASMLGSVPWRSLTLTLTLIQILILTLALALALILTRILHRSSTYIPMCGVHGIGSHLIGSRRAGRCLG